MPTLDLIDLTPYKSVVLVTGATDSESATRAIAGLQDEPVDFVIGQPASFGTYRTTHQPAWDGRHRGHGLSDAEHHLILCLVREDLGAIVTTDGGLRSQAVAAIRSGALGRLALLEPEILEHAFSDPERATRSVWLKGVHRRTPFQPDSKALGGSDVAQALDRLTDRTYFFDTVRTTPPAADLGKTLGIAKPESRIWSGPSSTWTEFESWVHAALDELEAAIALPAHERRALMPSLARPLTSSADVDDAFEMVLLPPDQDDDGVSTFTANQRGRLADLALSVDFEVTRLADGGLRALVLEHSFPIGTLKLKWLQDHRGRPSPEITVAQPVAGKKIRLETVARAARRADMLRVHYGSGHVLSHRRLFKVPEHDAPFDDWTWCDLSAWDIYREKPADLAATGGTGDSLFDWIVHHGVEKIVGATRGWLLCDDGPGEAADFVHLAPRRGRGQAALTLVHVKAAKSTKAHARAVRENDAARIGAIRASRGVAVTGFEQVGAQAMKSLSNFGLARLLEALDSPAGVQEKLRHLVWKDGNQLTSVRARRQFAGQLKSALNGSHSRRVALLHPQLRQSLVDSVRAGTAPAADKYWQQQIDTYLLSVAQSCRNVGAGLSVVGDSS